MKSVVVDHGSCIYVRPTVLDISVGKIAELDPALGRYGGLTAGHDDNAESGNRVSWTVGDVDRRVERFNVCRGYRLDSSLFFVRKWIETPHLLSTPSLSILLKCALCMG